MGFSTYGSKIENSKKKKKKNFMREVLGFEPELLGEKYTELPPCRCTKLVQGLT